MTETVTPLHGESAVEAQASAWIARLDSENWSESDQRQLREWIQRDPGHREAIQRLAALWGEMDTLTALIDSPPSLPARKRRRGWLALPLGALGAGAMATALLLLVFPPETPDPGAETAAQNLYTTAAGLQRDVRLPDGSRLQLNTRSYARVAFTDASRRVILLAGEAFFDVAHDPARPFLVQAGEREVRAVGTAFAVRMDARELEVLVTEGRVEVRGETKPGTPSLQVVSLGAGERVRVSDQLPEVQTLPEAEVTRRLLWRDQLLGFTDTPLAEVVAEYNRYSPTSIVISDEALRDMRIGGQFRTDDPEALLEALETSFGVRVVRGEDVILLSRLDREP